MAAAASAEVAVAEEAADLVAAADAGAAVAHDRAGTAEAHGRVVMVGAVVTAVQGGLPRCRVLLQDLK